MSIPEAIVEVAKLMSTPALDVAVILAIALTGVALIRWGGELIP